MLSLKKLVVTTAAVVGSAAFGVMWLGANSAGALVLFQDNFDAEPQNLSVTNLSNWDVIQGNVDVIGTSFFDFYPGNGNYLDMDGTTFPSVAKIETKQIFNLAPGQYELSFKIGNSPFLTNGLLVQLGSVFSESFVASSTLTSIVRSFTISTPTLAKLSFTETGTMDLGGSILDDVVLKQTQITTVPTPALLPGLIGLTAALRKRKQEKVEIEV